MTTAGHGSRCAAVPRAGVLAGPRSPAFRGRATGEGDSPAVRDAPRADDAAGRDSARCFRATARTGRLTPALPRVLALETADHPISADLTANGATTTVGGARSVLVGIRVTG
ncbi:hypothetical protein [Streptomyces sp. NPDC014676]|uniref:hypothetical protein n=1 Tax=Streptomyces sp. NPDC014676 TaxID=3364879 RepID=UPI0036FC7E0F